MGWKKKRKGTSLSGRDGQRRVDTGTHAPRPASAESCTGANEFTTPTDAENVLPRRRCAQLSWELGDAYTSVIHAVFHPPPWLSRALSIIIFKLAAATPPFRVLTEAPTRSIPSILPLFPHSFPKPCPHLPLVSPFVSPGSTSRGGEGGMACACNSQPKEDLLRSQDPSLLLVFGCFSTHIFFYVSFTRGLGAR